MQCKTLHFNACKNVHVSTLSRKSDVWKAFVMVQNTMQSIESHELEVFAVGILIFRKQDVKSFLILVLCTDRLNSERSIMWLTKISITSTQLLYIKQIISEEYYIIVFVIDSDFDFFIKCLWRKIRESSTHTMVTFLALFRKSLRRLDF